MAIGTCKVIALEGTHGSGKTTLAYALAAACKVDHLKATCMVERARTSPFVELAVRGVSSLDISGELHLFATQIADEQLLSRNSDVLFCDRTIASVLGYARLLLSQPDAQGRVGQLLAAMRDFGQVYKDTYDMSFFLWDNYALELSDDLFRPGGARYQQAAEVTIHEACAEIGLEAIDLPKGMSLEEKVGWVRSRLAPIL